MGYEYKALSEVMTLTLNLDKAKEIHELLFAFMGLFHEKFIKRFRQEHFSEHCLKKNHTKIMHVLYQHDHLSLTEIGKMLDIEKGSLTTLIDQLEERDLVNRANDPTDRRKTPISLSLRGRKEMDQIMNFYAQKMDEFLRDSNPEEIEQFLKSLQFVVQFMKRN